MSCDLRVGDCVEAMAAMEPASVDAIVTDPPYGLEFLGKEWDRLDGARIRQPTDRDQQAGAAHNATTSLVARNAPDAYVAGPRMQRWHEAWATQALRVLKPGGHMVAFGGTRTYHRLACGVEDAGFEIRDCLAWMYGSGFPKSLDVSKAIDKAAGAEREVVGVDPRYVGMSEKAKRAQGGVAHEYSAGWVGDPSLVTAPATPEAQTWQGWGTALKPAYEPIVLARKPLAGTVAGNVLAFGTGALNVDGCRIGTEERPVMVRTDTVVSASSIGRWPANVLLDEHAAAMLDEQSGESTGRPAASTMRGEPSGSGKQGMFVGSLATTGYEDTGGASRFFYTAKTSSDERHQGLATPSLFTPEGAPDRNDHPTVKPVDLMRWLCRLVTPPDGLILDPFLGSGSTGIAALLEGFRFVGIEREPDYMRIAEARISHWTHGPAEAT